MKKFSKVLIALVLIVAIAVGAYFLLSGKDSSKLVYQNVYNYKYNVKHGEKIIITEINSSVTEMRSLIVLHTMQLDEVQTGLEMYSNLLSYYTTVENHILEHGSFISNNNIDQYVNLATASYNKMIDLYNQSYTYLLDTYYEIENKSAYVETVKSYIQNFYEIFKNLIPEFNAFYYNTCLAYAHGLQNTMLKNNFYKLKVAYYAECVNQYYLNSDNRVLLGVQVISNQIKLNDDFAEKYFDNKDIYDELVSDFNADMGELVVTVATAKDNEYLDAIETEAERKIAQNHINYVARG